MSESERGHSQATRVQYLTVIHLIVSAFEHSPNLVSSAECTE